MVPDSRKETVTQSELQCLRRKIKPGAGFLLRKSRNKAIVVAVYHNNAFDGVFFGQVYKGVHINCILYEELRVYSRCIVNLNITIAIKGTLMLSFNNKRY